MPARFDDFLELYNADVIRRMAARWTRQPPTRKADCIALIRESLADPRRVRAVVANLEPFEHAALWLVKQCGGTLESGMLTVGLRATGLPLPASRDAYYGYREHDLLTALVDGGLLLSQNKEYRYYAAYGHMLLFGDERMLAQVSPLAYPPLEVPLTHPEGARLVRQPPNVALDLLGMLQALETLGGLHVGRSGAIRAPDLRKLERALGWKRDALELDGFAFPQPAQAFASALFHAGVLSLRDGVLALGGSLSSFAAQPYAEQVRRVLFGFAQTPEWVEYTGPHWYGGDGWSYAQARLALIVALSSLPLHSDGFVTLDALSDALFERVGEHFSIDNLIYNTPRWQETPAQARERERAWRAELRRQWRANERVWLERALSTWLYFLGIVELARQGDQLLALRLTEFGRAVLHPDRQPEPRARERPARAAWVVQPNFELVLYLDHASPEQLAFLERNAERVSVQQHTAQYRLTRDSVYRGLESGESAEQILAALAQGSAQPLPQNVQVEVLAWGGLREQITLRRSVRLLEFPTAEARDAALRTGERGAALGERFLLLGRGHPGARTKLQARVDYARPLPACLSISEDGQISIVRSTHDLLLEAQLDRWAERESEELWRLTRVSVSRAVQGSARRKQWLDELRARLVHPLPDVLAIALRAWAGATYPVALSEVVILRCEHAEVFQAIRTSPRFKPYLHGTLAPHTLLVKPDQLDALRAELEWMGLRISQTVEAMVERQAEDD